MSGGVPAGELLPCPFCGSEAEIERVGNHRQSTIYQCTSCSCSLETGEEWDHGRRWNMRATPTPPIEGRDADVERETVARLLCEQHGGDPDAVASDEHDCWDGPLWTAFVKDADAIRAALQALGERG